jgi:UTP--glucose-1-phosphate uridylyltransferase
LKTILRQLLDEVRAITPEGVTIMHVRQGQAKGLGHAVLCAKPVIGDEPFAVVLPDVLIDEYAADLKTENLAKMIQTFQTNGVSQVMVEAVPQAFVSTYGVADINGAELNAGDSAPMQAMVEKPKQEDAPSNLAVVGRYVLTEKIWSMLAQTPPGAGNEIQLTDAIAALMKTEQVDAFYMTGKSHDCGSKLGYMQAFVEYGLKHETEGKKFSGWLKKL